MQATDIEKFIFPQKEFLSELHRNCPEHPEIADFLQNGEKKENLIAKKRIIFEKDDYTELQFGDVITISEEKYGEICMARRTAAL